MTNRFGDGVAFIDGDFCPVAEARIPLLDWGFLRSDANQDTVTVWRGRFFRLDDHLDRFQRNLDKLRMICPHGRGEQRAILMELARRLDRDDAYVQMIGTRGRPPVGVRDLRACENRYYAFAIPYMSIATPEARARGLRLIVSDIWRVPPESVDPTIKHYHWLDFQMGLFQAYDRGAETVVLVDRDGNLTEGPGFNIFRVSGGRLETPAGGALDGVTRKTVFELCAESNVDCRLTNVPGETLAASDEVFLSSSAGGIIPVTIVDGQAIGDGAPGPLTTRLEQLYWSKREAGWHGTPVEPAAT